MGVLGGGWTRKSGGGRARGGRIDELVYLVSVLLLFAMTRSVVKSVKVSVGEVHIQMAHK